MADPSAAFSRGNLMRRLEEVEDRLAKIETDPTLEAASIGRGGLAVKGGAIVIYDAQGVEQMRLSTAGLSLEGLLSVLGSIRATDGSIAAADSEGDVFRVDPTVPEIFMRPELISAVARQIIGDSVFSQDADDEIVLTDTSSSFVAAPDANGPSLSNVSIGPSGRAVVFISANILAAPTGTGLAEVTGAISYEVSGATSIAALFENAAVLTQVTGLSDDSDISITASVSRISLLTDLNEGLHGFEAKYRVDESQSGDEGSFIFRNITVIAF